jgi:hypothetical protein
VDLIDFPISIYAVRSIIPVIRASLNSVQVDLNSKYREVLNYS